MAQVRQQRKAHNAIAIESYLLRIIHMKKAESIYTTSKFTYNYLCSALFLLLCYIKYPIIALFPHTINAITTDYKITIFMREIFYLITKNAMLNFLFIYYC